MEAQLSLRAGLGIARATRAHRQCDAARAPGRAAEAPAVRQSPQDPDGARQTLAAPHPHRRRSRRRTSGTRIGGRCPRPVRHVIPLQRLQKRALDFDLFRDRAQRDLLFFAALPQARTEAFWHARCGSNKRAHPRSHESLRDRCARDRVTSRYSRNDTPSFTRARVRCRRMYVSGESAAVPPTFPYARPRRYGRPRNRCGARPARRIRRSSENQATTCCRRDC